MSGTRFHRRLREASIAVLIFGIGVRIGSRPVVSARIHSDDVGSAPDRPVNPSSSREEVKFRNVLTREVTDQAQADLDQGVSFPDVDQSLRPFDQSWVISRSLQEKLGLDEEESKIAQEEIDQTRQEFGRLVKANIDLVESDPGDESFPARIRIRPFMNEGHSELDRLHAALVKRLPESKGEELFRYFRWRRTLGAFGANEVEMTFRVFEEAEIIRRNRMTGAVITRSVWNKQKLLDEEGYDLSDLRTFSH